MLERVCRFGSILDNAAELHDILDVVCHLGRIFIVGVGRAQLESEKVADQILAIFARALQRPSKVVQDAIQELVSILLLEATVIVTLSIHGVYIAEQLDELHGWEGEIFSVHFAHHLARCTSHHLTGVCAHSHRILGRARLF